MREPRLVGGGVVAEGGEEVAVVVGEVAGEIGGGEKVGAVGEGFGEGGVATPAADGEVVAAAKGRGDGEAEEVGGTGVVGVVEETGGGVGGAGNAIGREGVEGAVGFAEAFETGGVGVAEDAGEEASDGVDEDGGGEFAAGEDEVADGELVVAEELGDALVDAFVAAADEDDAIEGGETAGGGLGEALALGGEEEDGLPGVGVGGRVGVGGALGFGGEGERLEAVVDGLGFEDHAFAAAEGAVVDGAVAVVCEGAEVVGVDAGEAGAEGSLEDAVTEDALAGEVVGGRAAGGGVAEEVGEDREDVEAHRGRGESG